MKPMSLSTPHLIIMVGIPGSGKSFFAEHFASTFNAPFVSKKEIESRVDLGSSNNNDEALNSMSDYMLEQLLKTGQTIIYEGDTSTRVQRQNLSKLATERNYEPLLVWVQTESLAAKARALKNRSKSLTSDEFDKNIRQFTPPNAAEKAVVISGKHTYASQLKIVLNRLASVRNVGIVPRQSAIQPERRTITIR